MKPNVEPTSGLNACRYRGAAAISVLCEPHWFTGSVADLTAVRAAVRIPVLAKDGLMQIFTGTRFRCRIRESDRMQDLGLVAAVLLNPLAVAVEHL